MPTLILHGDDDQIVPIAASALLSAKIVKNATLKVYPGLAARHVHDPQRSGQRRAARVPQGVGAAANMSSLCGSVRYNLLLIARIIYSGSLRTGVDNEVINKIGTILWRGHEFTGLVHYRSIPGLRAGNRSRGTCARRLGRRGCA